MNNMRLWVNDYPTCDNIKTIQAEFYSICADLEEFQHGAAISVHNDMFYATFGQNTKRENSDGERTVCYCSNDGKNWNYHSIIGDDTDTGGRSHGILFEHGGVLWAYNAAFTGPARYNIADTAGIYFPGLRTDAFYLDDKSGRWIGIGTITDDFWPLNPPVRINETDFIIPGANSGFYSAYIIGNIDCGWVKYDTPTEKMPYTETACVCTANEIILYMRNSRKDLKDIENSNRYLAAAISNDSGKTWNVGETNIFETNSKPCAGTLSDGRNYLVSNSLPDQGTSRSNLTITYTEPGSTFFNEMRLIRSKYIPESLASLYAPQIQQNNLSYPYSIEHDGKLYIVYSSHGGIGGYNRNRIELAVINLDSFD